MNLRRKQQQNPNEKPTPMKRQNTPLRWWTCLAAAALLLIGTASVVQAAPTPLNATLALRPLTPTEIEEYGLGSTNEASGGLTTIAVGEPAYLEALVNIAIDPATITNVTWTLVAQPPGSMVTNVASPLGTNVPVYYPADQTVYQVAGRQFLRPDVVGPYTVNVTIQTSGSGSTNLSLTITAATYVGVAGCAACHKIGGYPGAPAVYNTYTNTLHASFFTKAIDGLESSHYSQSCIVCHTLGYDTNSFADFNGGFDDMARLLHWTFPAILTNGNWAAMPSQLQNLANIQCEHCHGPGSQHFYGSGDTNLISVSYGAGDCSQCHDEMPHHSKSAEWNNSLHARSARETRPECVRCHTGPGFIGWATAGGMAAQNMYPTNIIAANAFSTNILTTAPDTTYDAVDCQACHNPHNASNPHQLRLGTTVTLSDGTVVTNAGFGGFCMECHNSRNGSVTNMMAKYPLNQPNWAGGVGFGPHDSPQGDMLEGVNAITYGKVIPNSPHANVVSNTCAGCHMQPIASTDPAFTLAGGHTFKMDYLNTNGVDVDVTYVCTQCHGKLDDFNFPVADYNGDGVIEGVQTEVQHLLDKLSTLLPPAGYHVNPNDYVPDGLVKAINYRWGATNMPLKYLQAAYNWQFVANDGSLGVHNAAYAVGLLKASIGDLTGDDNEDGLPDAWQIKYFGAGFATNALAGPNAVNNSANVPNWMMYALNLDPRSNPIVTDSGVIYFNGDNIVNGATNTVAIYRAAEIAFNTQVGVNYQIQGISDITGTWQNISTNIPGTGGSISYVTPTRDNAQMFFRVVSSSSP
jgi:hypothetical protein